MAHTDPHVHHETSDAQVGGVWRFLTVTVVFLAVSFGLMAGLYKVFQASRDKADVKPAPMAQRQGDRLPPLPRLQTTPYGDLATFRADEARVLSTYDWVDHEHGVVRMPIEAAIARVAAAGLPGPAPAPVVPSEASTGVSVGGVAVR